MSLFDCPEEIIQHVFEYLPPEDTLHIFQLVSKRSCRIANEPTLWRHYCRISFRYWSPEHRIRERIFTKGLSVDWKAIFIHRKKKNRRIASLFEDVLRTRVRRHLRMEQICLCGYDAKDYLLEQCRVPESAEDPLSRRYFANAILESIHRSIALKEWGQAAIYDERPTMHQLAMGYRKKRLERLLGAFDMFFIQEDEPDIDRISREFDLLSRIFLRQHPGFESKTLRTKALMLNKWLRMYDYTGMTDHSKYRLLTNCLIGHALLEPHHDSLPVISTAIFVALAHRLDIPAAPCAFPSHVHVVVSRTETEGLDGPTKTPIDQDTDMMMYLDPYGSNYEVSKEELRTRLIERGWDGSSTIPYLRPTADHEIVLRVAQNIRASCTSAMGWSGSVNNNNSTNSRINQREGNPFFTMLYGRNTLQRNAATIRDTAMYTTLWSAVLMVQPEEREDWTDLLIGVLSMVASDWTEDVWMVQKYLGPLFDRHRARFPTHQIDPALPDVWMWCMQVKQADRLPLYPMYRSNSSVAEMSEVKFRIGQVVRHKRYDFIGIIIAWSVKNNAGPGSPTEYRQGWDPESMREAQALGGLYADRMPYYSCLRDDDTAKFVVREHSIEPVHTPQCVSDSLLRLAGKYFKKFDRENCVFVSNMKEIFPDD